MSGKRPPSSRFKRECQASKKGRLKYRRLVVMISELFMVDLASMFWQSRVLFFCKERLLFDAPLNAYPTGAWFVP